ncbi:hypothetical protein TanjilG_22507 [Lupinus angustifolius]|uniref:Kinesin-like protein n=2 Tax=Lupinus angustifolius TaxID=3871 RepID=A0A4P1RT64_LUPAN|nr:hypothetical protein TanjilG_22507 [Lupinus angustifolius]
MASKQGVKSRRFGFNSSKTCNSPSSKSPSSPSSSSKIVPFDAQRAKENVTVTVRFRPLNQREIQQGEEIAWYADGETVVRNENNPSVAYAYDRVFGPTTTTRHVYDVAAQHVVSGAMEGINGTIFAYGVTSSGKTHTMHGDQRSPGIIPLAVKDAFSIIQETPNREFLLRLSYFEIYNEVVNDLLNPEGQNLRVRQHTQGTFIEGIKEEVVLSPAHALSLIAAGEEHRHVGSTNFNLLSSRSHTIFTLTIESSPRGKNSEGEAVTLSQLNLIDLAGSESSKAATTGMRRREGSYINKSLLTLATVISKLTEEKPSHIPYRDSKLTRLLQSSLSGHGRVSLICPVTPSSSSTEETHNTLKFAHRAKHIEIQAAQNKIIDERSLIKKYQQEIQCLREELEQLKRGNVTVQSKDTEEDNIGLLKQKLEDGQVRLQSRLEQEEEAKAALLGRIQRLTKLILISTKTSNSTTFPNRPSFRRSHSFGEKELAYLPYKRGDFILDDENIDLYANLEGNYVTADDSFKEDENAKKYGLLNWLKSRTSIKSVDHIYLLREEHKILSGEVVLHSSTLKMLSEETARNPQNDQIHVEIKRLKDEIKAKSEQIGLLEKQISRSLTASVNMDRSGVSQVKSADKGIIQEKLKQKICECESLQETITTLKQQLADAMESINFSNVVNHSQHLSLTKDYSSELYLDKGNANFTNGGTVLQAKISEIEQLKQKVAELTESKEQLELRNQKLAEENSYAKGLASASVVELKALSKEFAKLIDYNQRLAAELAATKNLTTQRRSSGSVQNARRESHARLKRNDQAGSNSDIKRELALSKDQLYQKEIEIQRKMLTMKLKCRV